MDESSKKLSFLIEGDNIIFLGKNSGHDEDEILVPEPLDQLCEYLHIFYLRWEGRMSLFKFHFLDLDSSEVKTPECSASDAQREALLYFSSLLPELDKMAKLEGETSAEWIRTCIESISKIERNKIVRVDEGIDLIYFAIRKTENGDWGSI